MPELDYPRRIAPQPEVANHHHPYPCKPELDHLHYRGIPHDPLFLQLPQLESPNLLTAAYSITQLDHQESIQADQQLQFVDQVTDWRVLDKFVASQLSHDEASKAPEAAGEYASTSNSSAGQIDPWMWTLIYYIIIY